MAEPAGVRFARTGRGLGDKCDEQIKADVPGHLKEALSACAALYGMTTAEYLRNLVHEHVYGRLDAIRMHAQVPRGEGRD